MGLPKQRQVKEDWYELPCFGCPKFAICVPACASSYHVAALCKGPTFKRLGGAFQFLRAIERRTCMMITEHFSLSLSLWRFSQQFSQSISVSPECRDSLEAVSPPLSLPFFPLFYQCDGCLFFSPSTSGLMAGLPGFASHGSGLHLEAGCQ